jgi:hypothetical protein
MLGMFRVVGAKSRRRHRVRDGFREVGAVVGQVDVEDILAVQVDAERPHVRQVQPRGAAVHEQAGSAGVAAARVHVEKDRHARLANAAEGQVAAPAAHHGIAVVLDDKGQAVGNGVQNLEVKVGVELADVDFLKGKGSAGLIVNAVRQA